MAVKIYMTSADAERTVAFDLLLDNVGQDLTSATVECHMRDTRTGAVTTVTDVTADADQVTYPGRCVTEFSAANLVVGTYTLEWESTISGNITTFPGDGDERPLLIVRAEAA